MCQWRFLLWALACGVTVPATKVRRTGHLADLGVKPITAVRYKNALGAFFSWLHRSGWARPTSFSTLDTAAAAYVNFLYQSGEAIGAAGLFLSALGRAMPRARHRVPTARLWFRNWRVEVAPVRALPLPGPVLAGLAGIALTVGRADLAALLPLGFFGLLRTGELTRLTAGQCHFSLDRASVVITLASTKTSARRGGPEEVVIKDRVTCRLLQRVLRDRSCGRRVYSKKPAAFSRELRWLASKVHFAHPRLSGYSLRRGGATWHLHKYGSLSQTAVLGRWKHATTARIYIEGGAAELALWVLQAEARRRLALASSVVLQACAAEPSV